MTSFRLVKKLFLGLLLPLFLCSCGGNTVEVEDSELTWTGDTVDVRTDSPILSHIKVDTVHEELFSSEMRTTGTAKAEMGHYAEVGLPFDGRITRSYVALGNKVRAGQALFEVYSPDFNELVRNCFQARQSYERAVAEYNRQQKLMEHGIAAQKAVEESRLEMENLHKEVEAAEATLKIYHVDPTQLKSGQPVRICSPINGEVVQNSLTTGQFTRTDDAAPIIVADLSSMWVTAMVKERYVGTIATDDQAEVILESDPEHPIMGKIRNVGNLVDEESRSVQVVVSCANPDRRLKHGMFVSVHFLSKPHQTIVLPSSAVFQGEESSYVYVQIAEGKYVRRQVVVGASNDDRSRISVISGLELGEKVVIDGGIYLNQ